jgi:PAS domain S-box-containing protein
MNLHPGPEEHRDQPVSRAADPIPNSLQENYDWYQDLVEHSEDLFCTHDLEGRLLSVNPRPAKMLGYSVQELLKIPMRELVSPEFRAQFEDYLKQIGETGEASGLLSVLTRSGERRIWRYHNTLRKTDAAPQVVCGIAHDVTEQLRTEKMMRETSENLLAEIRKNEATIRELKLFRVLVDQSNDAVVVVDSSRLNFVDVNAKACADLGYTREELLSLGVPDIDSAVTPDSVARIREELGKSGSAVIESIHRRKDGSTFPVEVSMKRVVLDRPYVVAIIRNLTERKQAEEALRRSEENYRMFIAQSSEGIFREDMDAPVSIDLPEDELIRHILYDSYMAECNDAMVKMYGFESKQEFVGKRLTELLPPDDPRNIELTREFIRSGFSVLERESHEIDVHGNPKVFLNSMIGIVENRAIVRTWGIQRDVTEKVKLEEARRKVEEDLRNTVRQLSDATAQLSQAKEKLLEEKIYLEEAIGTELGFGDIIGRSDAVKGVMEKVARVASSDATVLLLGETGTGKELVARAIHGSSKRKGKSFIKLNCAAIPSGLLESELFGHEKGAFTGAVSKKAGRIELADKGTLFLDEIGEISLSLQPKLLRVLQDQEFERLGGTQTLKVDFRLIAATNRDLLQSVNQREFRSDLYYRLNVFPIRTPPLRERRNDIPLLVEHFVRKYAARMNKSIASIPAKTMETLVRWSWPGNIRELENFVERSVILTAGSMLQVPIHELDLEENEVKDETLREKDREEIIRALRECSGQLGGPNGAAARLGLRRTTLQSKLGKLKINPSDYRA